MKISLFRLSLSLFPALLLVQCALQEATTGSRRWQSSPVSYSKPRLWNQKHLTWRVECLELLSGRLSKEELNREIDKSFKSWEAAGVFTFSQASEDEEADIIITFKPPAGRVWDGQLGTMGHASFPWTQNRGRIHLDPSEWWSSQSFSLLGDPILKWLPHEIGHVLGLPHTHGADHTMCATGPYDLPDDRSFSRLRHLYAPRTPVIAWTGVSTASSRSPSLRARRDTAEAE